MCLLQRLTKISRLPRMTGIPRLQHLPVPVATTGATAVALPDSGRQAKAVVPVTPLHPRQAQAERSNAWTGGAARQGAEVPREAKRGERQRGLMGYGVFVTGGPGRR